jgi:hypothetical protein
MMQRIAPILLVLLLACGGGGGGTSVAGGGIGGTGISSGPITGIGSFFVTGTEWSVGSGGVVLLDGRPFSESDLALGMVVTVEGTRAANGTGTATRVEFDDDVEGPLDPTSFDPVSCPSPDETCFTVFGQRFVADRNTIYAGTTFSGFRFFFSSGVNAVIEVSGLPDMHPIQGEVIRATRIEVKEPSGPVTGVTEVEFEGAVQCPIDPCDVLDPFTIGPVSVTINDPDPACGMTSLEDAELPLESGDSVEVEGIYLGIDAVCATRIELEDALPDTDEFEIEGIVTLVVSNESFWLAGIEVDAAGAEFEPASLQVQEGMRLEVEGALAGGVLVAEEVKQRGEVELEAVVTELIDGGFVLLGRDIFVDAATEVEDGPVAVGKFVDVRAVDDGAGGLTATEVKVQPGGDRVRVQGRIESVPQSPEDPPTLTIAGISIPTDDGTRCEDASGAQFESCDDFFALVQVGDEVQATDDDNDYENFGSANELAFED